MGVEVVKAARERSEAEGPAFAVLWYLADRVFDKRIEADEAALAWPSHSTIAGDIRFSVRTVARALQRLEELDEIRDTGMRRGPEYHQTIVWSILPDVFGEAF